MFVIGLHIMCLFLFCPQASDVGVHNLTHPNLFHISLEEALLDLDVTIFHGERATKCSKMCRTLKVLTENIISN
jgi:hypothetical protein